MEIINFSNRQYENRYGVSENDFITAIIAEHDSRSHILAHKQYAFRLIRMLYGKYGDGFSEVIQYIQEVQEEPTK
jgi:hypothetical protein